jgi:hypothetical protein
MLPALLGLFFTSGVKAEPVAGINTTYYTIDAIPPVQSVDEYPICGTETENNINRSYDGEPYENCTGDLFMVHMTGFIDIPEHETIEFMLATDDGGTMEIGEDSWGNWNDQGCSWMMSGELTLEPGSNAFQVWMYEHGGNSCLMLAWKIDNNDWEIVPEWAFTTTSTPQTTTSTTTVPETTVPVTVTTSTTVPQTSTTVAVTTSLAASTTVAVSTTDVTTTVPVTSTSVVETSTTTTSTVFVPTQTTSTIVYIVPETTTTTTEPEVTTTTQEVTTTVETTIPEETTTSTTETPSQTSLEPVTEEQTSVPSTTVEMTIQTLLEPPTEDIDVTNLPNSSEEVAAFIKEVVSNPDQLSQLSVQQLEQVFEQLDVSELTLEEAEQLVEVLNDAPTKVKKAFQETVNVFSGLFNSYVMVGQNIPVEDRRTLLAVTNAMTISGISLRRRSK